jgi:hypothetical protein
VFRGSDPEQSPNPSGVPLYKKNGACLYAMTSISEIIDKNGVNALGYRLLPERHVGLGDWPRKLC